MLLTTINANFLLIFLRRDISIVVTYLNAIIYTIVKINEEVKKLKKQIMIKKKKV